MSRFLIAAGALALGLTGAASAGRLVSQPEASYELRLADVTALPESTAGYLVFKTCPSCNATSVTLSPDTVFVLGAEPVPFEDFLRAAQGYRQEAGGPTHTNVFVYYAIATRHVNRVVLNHFGA